MKHIIFYDTFNDKQDISFSVGDRLYDILKSFCLFHTKSSECRKDDKFFGDGE